MTVYFDVQTLLLTYGWLLVGLGGIPLYIGFTLKPTESNLIFWSSSQIVFGTSMVLTSLRPILPDWLGYHVVGQTFLAAMLMKCMALESLSHSKIHFFRYAVWWSICVAIFWFLHETGRAQERILFIHINWVVTVVYSMVLINTLDRPFEAVFALQVGFVLLLLSIAGNILVVVTQNLSVLEGSLDLISSLPMLLAITSAIALSVGYLNLVLKEQEYRIGFEMRNREAAEKSVDRLTTLTQKLEQTIVERDEVLTHLARMSRSMQVESFASALVHEINQPLSTMRLNLDYLKKLMTQSNQTSDEREELIAEITAETRRLEATVSSIRQLVTKRAVLRPKTTLNALIFDVRKMVARVAEIKRTELEFMPIPGGDVQIIEVGLLEQVLFNTLFNAIEAIDQSNCPNGRVVIGGIVREQEIEIWVDDNGPGIPEADRARCLLPFYTNKQSGTGLGLSIANTIMQRLGGDLSLAESPLKGLRLSLKLPLIG